MKQTMKVRELITHLLDFDMDEPVYIGLGPNGKPDGSASIQGLGDYCSGGLNFEFGVYLIPHQHIIDADEESA